LDQVDSRLGEGRELGEGKKGGGKRRDLSHNTKRGEELSGAESLFQAARGKTINLVQHRLNKLSPLRCPSSRKDRTVLIYRRRAHEVDLAEKYATSQQVTTRGGGQFGRRNLLPNEEFGRERGKPATNPYLRKGGERDQWRFFRN